MITLFSRGGGPRISRSSTGVLILRLNRDCSDGVMTTPYSLFGPEIRTKSWSPFQLPGCPRPELHASILYGLACFSLHLQRKPLGSSSIRAGFWRYRPKCSRAPLAVLGCAPRTRQAVPPDSLPAAACRRPDC